MSRMMVALIALLIATTPVAGLTVRASGHGGNDCCVEAGTHCGDSGPTLRCCRPDTPDQPASPPPQLTSSPSGRDVPVAEIGAPPAPAALIAVVASRAFLARQGLIIHAPPVLCLCTLLI
jgi:hypothetical protein